jgi:hypothetical protein
MVGKMRAILLCLLSAVVLAIFFCLLAWIGSDHLDQLNDTLDDALGAHTFDRTLKSSLQPNRISRLSQCVETVHQVYEVPRSEERQCILVTVNKDSTVYMDGEQLIDVPKRTNDNVIYAGYIEARRTGTEIRVVNKTKKKSMLHLVKYRS